MPAKWNPARHPRDKRGRFTKSRTVRATKSDYQVVKDIHSRYQPTDADHSYAEKIARPEHEQVAEDFASDAAAINAGLRAGDTDMPGVKAMDDAMMVLPEDVTLYRTVQVSQLGNIDPTDLWGMKVRDAGYFPTQLDMPAPAEGQVRMLIVTPKGSRGVPNPVSGEVYLHRDSELVIAATEPNGAGGFDMYMTLMPKAEAKAKPGSAKTGTTADVPANRPEGSEQVRADLMKLKVGQLQAQMRERGLKPGKKRKSDLVNALVADEFGHTDQGTATPESATPPTPAVPAPTGPGSFTASAGWSSALTGEEGFAAATPIEWAASRAATDRRIRQRDLGRVVRAASAYGQDPRDGDLNYVTINAAIRGHSGGIDPDALPEIKQTVKDLDLLISGAPVVRDTITYRGFQNPAAAIPGWQDDADNAGLEWTAEGYQSTTTIQDVAADFASGLVPGGTRSNTPTVARVLIPKGSPGLRMAAVVGEILTARNQRFHLVADRGVQDGVRQLDIELVAEGGGDG